MKFENVLHMRRSVRAFMEKQITEQELAKILRAAQMAPLAMGDDKTTHITVLQQPELLNEIRKACSLKSRKTGETMDAFYGAPTIIFLSATDISEDHIEYCNVACVIENIILQATALNLGSIYIWGCLKKLRAQPETVAKLKLPEGYEILSAVAVGHPGKPLEYREPKERLAVSRI
ncbi:MAG: nitroreductase family protein [Candidatus Adiutrix sp.]|jgi:nitroreductase|nr:nitroreductase family protein [Candidatus Adiutrix sp.]